MGAGSLRGNSRGLRRPFDREHRGRMKLMRRLLRPLWHEDSALRRRRRLRTLITVPVLGFAGVVWGILSGPGGGSASVGWALGGAMGFASFAWLYLRLQPALSWWAERTFDRGGRLAGAMLDWGIGAAVVWLLVDVAGMPTYPAVSTAVGLGGAYAAAVAGFFGDAGDAVLGGLLSVVRGGGGHRIAPAFSHIEAHLAANRVDEAEQALAEFVEDHPGDARGWLVLGRLVGRDAARSAEAVAVLREGVSRVQPEILTRQRYVAEIVSIVEREGRPERAGRDLALLAEAAPLESPTALWARAELERLKEKSDAGRGGR